MMATPPDGARLWALIVQYGLEEEYERDWLGRVKSRKTKRYLKAEVTPELATLLANTSAQFGSAAGAARAALSATPENVRRLLSSRETDKAPDA